MKKLLTGNEAVAQGAYEAGITYAAAYPGTPSTEILETISKFKEDIIAEWAPNEKVALESVIGASMVGARTIAAMKMVGVNVAADPFFNYAYTGVNGAMILVSADDPGIHSSQNEQDNRNYAKFARYAMLEPSSSQEAKNMIIEAAKISEEYDTPILFRMTTRICHSKSLVEIGEREEVGKKPYSKNLQKFDLIPSISKKLRVNLENRLNNLEKYSNETDLNYFEWNDKKIGIITSGIAFEYAKEVFGESASYLKLGFTYPLPMEKIKKFSKEVDTLYVIEEVDPFIEEQIKAKGIQCIGKEKIPKIGELTVDVIKKAFGFNDDKPLEYDKDKAVARPPTMCAGCPHRGFFTELKKKKNIMVSGDIGCYGLGGNEPLNTKDTSICMGASISMAHGAQKVFNKFNSNMRVVSTIGDSTFFHTGINSLMQVAYNKSNTITCILDNRITAMTGQQENPGTGYTLQNDPANSIDIENLVKAIGIENVKTVNPLNLKEMRTALDWAFDLNEPVVIITRWPCALKKLTEEDKKEFNKPLSQCEINPEKCVGCRMCVRTGCPALRYNKDTKKVKIDSAQCVGCEVCMQVCNFGAIERRGK
jgi:indolepyruvate ferredoxin oxidoreductase alpha subunit